MLPLLHGDGSNGKNTFVEALLAALGPYGTVAPRHFLSQRTHDEHLTEIADLYRRRLVVVDETQQGGRLDEDKVKVLPGGRPQVPPDVEDPWEYDATDTIIMLGNHKPVVRGDDYAIWRRVKLGPFDATFVGAVKPPRRGSPAGSRTPAWRSGSRAELPGILVWIVRGARAWYRDGLCVLPTRVEAASTRYQREQDALGRFLNEECVAAASAEVYATPLYHAYRDWLVDQGERPGTQKAFGERMRLKGYAASRRHRQ